MSSTICPIRVARDAGISLLPYAAGGMEGTSPVYPYGGGPLTQPAVLADAVTIYTNEKARADALLRQPKGAK